MTEYKDFPNVFSSMEDSFEIFDPRSCVEERFSPELQEHTMTFDGDSRKLENSSFQKRKDFKINIPFESRNLDKKSQPLKSAKQPPRCTPKDILRISTRSKINRKQRFDYLSFQSTNSERHGCTFNSPEAESRPLPLPPIFSPTIITYINTEYGCTSMSCLGDEKIWTCHLNDKILRLYNLQGELMESIRSKSGQYDITVTGTGGLVYTDSKDRTVNIINKGEIQTVISLQEWKPYGLCSTSSGDLLVIIISDDEKQTKVVRYSGSSLKQTIQYNDMGQSLFSSSCNTKYISENRNLDICVSDWSACAVVAVNQSGKLRFTYTGHPSTTKGSFSPVGITTDSQSRILTADLNSSCIHILNQDGQFLHYIKDRYVSLPWGLCVDTKDNLFVSEYITGIVKMIEYCI